MGGQWDNFLVKFDVNGIRQKATYFGEDLVPEEDFIGDLAIDTVGSVYVLSLARALGGGIQATPGAYDTTLDGMSSDVVITKFDPSLKRIWATYYGGSGYETGSAGIAVERFKVYAVGVTSSPNTMATPGSHKTMLGYMDGFIVKFAK